MTFIRGAGLSAAAAALAVFALTAQAQQPQQPAQKTQQAPATTKAEPKDAKKDAAKKETKKKDTPKKTASACKGLDQAACTGNEACSWVGASKRKGKDVSAYCRSKPKSKKKK